MNTPRIGVIGAGLIGGSIVKAAAHARYPVTAYDIDTSARDALIHHGVAWAHSLRVLVERTDLIILAVPADQIGPVVTAISPYLREGQILTDVASVKTSPSTVLATAPAGVIVVGGHPLAGKATAGAVNADRHLFEGCVWVLCPQDGVTVPTELHKLIADLGCHRTLVCTPEEHDRAVASISHGVQAAATSLAAAVNSIVADDRLPWILAAGGWRDSTRIAESDPDMWVPILLENADNVSVVLDETIERLVAMRAALDVQDEIAVRALLVDGNTARRNWAQNH